MRTQWIGTGLRMALRRRVRWLGDERARGQDAGAIQRRQLRTLLGHAATTEVGREFGFARLADLPDAEMVPAYREAMPVADYERHRAQMVRMREQGEANICWPGIVQDWAQTSGTTGGEKYIPVTREMMASNRKSAMDIFAHAMRFGMRLEDIFAGRLLFLGGSTDVTVNEHGIRTGDLSGLVTPLIGWPLSKVYTPGADVALLDHWPTKIERIATLTVDQDVRFVSGMASWSLVLFERIVEIARTQGRDVSTLRDIWPKMQLFVHGGVRYAPFDSRVRRVWSGSGDVKDSAADIPYRLEVYPASEGFIALQDRRGEPSLRMHVDNGIFFEFVPVETINDDAPRAYMCDEVEPGQRYVVVMTTCAGLWRYVIGDVVEFDCVPPDGPPRMRIVGRHRHFINAFGENLIVEEIESAVVAASEAASAIIGEFTAGPVYPGDGQRGAVELVLEWADDEAQVSRFVAIFDAELKRRNVDYTTKRTASLGMGPPRVTRVPMGRFDAWMASRGKLGGQHKVPRCANHREYVDALAHAGARGVVQGP